MRAWLLAFAILAAPVAALSVASGSASAGGFTPDLFDAWIKMRAGDGTPVYWYAKGNVLQEGTGKLLSHMEGFEAAVAIRDPAKPHVRFHLSRKIFILLDPATGEILTGSDGKPRAPVAYPFQVRSYTLEGDDIVYTVQSHDMTAVTDEPPQRNFTAKRLGNVTHFNYAMFVDRLRGDGSRTRFYEVNDFFLRPDAKTEQARFQNTWVSAGPGPTVSNATFTRTGTFESMPKRIVDYVKANAPLWMLPPKDMAEIERLRAVTPMRLEQR